MAFLTRLRQLGLVLTTGYILFFFSERLFWTTFRAGDRLGDSVITWLAYSVVTYLFLAIVSLCRVRQAPATFVAGAMYGWLVEGGVARTLYGTEDSAPFPLSLLCTGVSWHALISVMVGWYLAPRLLRRDRPWPALALAVGLGLFWGLWATFLWAETPPEVTPVPSFLAYGCIATALLVACYWASERLGRLGFRPTWPGLGASVVLVGLFYAQHVAALGLRPLIILPALLIGGCAVLATRRAVSAPPDAQPPPPHIVRNGLALMAAPFVATGVYALLLGSGLDCTPIRDTLWWAMIWVGGTALVITVAAVLLGWPRHRSDAHQLHNGEVGKA